ncbi:acyl-CoA dehydrogenase family protein [Azospirillum sp. TSH64]|uniref:acyl-CoA dehydrogenase family protein n=1 Tax=Azospirillum sp. TSH64 TaxID=652740 RepID=UPI001FFFCEC4|nr:acyl-CoA dehydrogenase family protein [Azospirillum sp. TSH64]
MVSDTSQILVDTATRLFEEQFTAKQRVAAESGQWLDTQWQAVEDMGLPLALVPEEAGGFGLPLVEALDLIRLAGAFAVPLPLAETMLANRILASAGLELPGGPLTLAPVRPDDRLTLSRRDGGWLLSGTAHRVPWGRVAATVVLARCEDPGDDAGQDGQSFAALVPAGQADTAPDVNLAKEPRDSLRFETLLPAESVAPSPGIAPAELHALGAAVRSIAMAGALGRVLAMTTAYANERSQFGRPIGKFQAIQQHLAVLAGQAAAARAAGDIAAEAVAQGGALLPIAAAKLRCGEAAGVAAAIAHQVHGAMGFTHEHSLHFFTKRLWSWRDEFGGEGEWGRLIGREVGRAGADGLWPLVTAA